MMKGNMVFIPDHLENCLITSQNVMDLSIGILLFQGRPLILHPPSCMDETAQRTYLENSCTQQEEDNNEYQLLFHGKS